MDFNKAEYSKKDLWWALTKAVAATFILTMIYARFLSTESGTSSLKTDFEEFEITYEEDKKEIKKEIEDTEDAVNGRMDRKTGRIEEKVKELEREINKLKMPNTDGNK